MLFLNLFKIRYCLNVSRCGVERTLRCVISLSKIPRVEMSGWCVYIVPTPLFKEWHPSPSLFAPVWGCWQELLVWKKQRCVFATAVSFRWRKSWLRALYLAIRFHFVVPVELLCLSSIVKGKLWRQSCNCAVTGRNWEAVTGRASIRVLFYCRAPPSCHIPQRS